MHGSLARAGKVRGQCPKVPKQEKKKQPKGRAMKRLKYNRRFVNVVVGCALRCWGVGGRFVGGCRLLASMFHVL